MFKKELRFIFGDKSEIHLSEVESRIATLTDGCDLFKKLFVLHALSSFLTPSQRMNVDMRLAKVISMVDEIKSFNWCEYVMERFCEAQITYRESGGVHWHCGCLILIEIVYFHRLIFKGAKEPCTFPVIQHWDNAKLKHKIDLESDSMRYGIGTIDKPHTL